MVSGQIAILKAHEKDASFFQERRCRVLFLPRSLPECERHSHLVDYTMKVQAMLARLCRNIPIINIVATNAMLPGSGTCPPLIALPLATGFSNRARHLS
jgi:hypothetical protein